MGVSAGVCRSPSVLRSPDIPGEMLPGEVDEVCVVLEAFVQDRFRCSRGQAASLAEQRCFRAVPREREPTSSCGPGLGTPGLRLPAAAPPGGQAPR